ncbi:MAG: family 16 glycosylhydrolase [Chitinivibrionales bacterium]|nr:family 16 glycosylhydrolase [Chitinivibrionales bacterium]
MQSVMRSILLIVSLGIVVLAQNNRQLVWQDEFNTPGPVDETSWRYEIGKIRNNEAQYYTNREENIRIEDTVLIIEGRRDNWNGNTYTSASIETETFHSWTYARIEVRAKIPTGTGTWPAIWTLGDNIPQVGWPDCGEIDIMENVGKDPDRIHGTIHTEAFNHTRGTQIGESILVDEGPYNDFHVYAVEWYPDSIVWFFDSTRYFKFENTGGDDDEWPFHRPQHLKINLAIGGSWGGTIDTTIFPLYYLIDYVRVYQHSEQTAVSGPYSIVPGNYRAGEIHPNHTRATDVYVTDFMGRLIAGGKLQITTGSLRSGPCIINSNDRSSESILQIMPLH